MQNEPKISPADLRAEVPPVSERFASFELGDSLVVFEEEDTDRWILSDTARDLNSMW